MNHNVIKRGKSQVMFRYLPGSVFFEKKMWYKVDDLLLNKINEDTSHLLNQVRKFVESWSANAELQNNPFPKQDELYLFGEIEQVIYNIFPHVFRCEICNNVHEYRNIGDILKLNSELKCKFCNKGYLVQYPYALIHANGDIQSIKVATNKGAKSWKDKYNGIKMNDTRRFTTASWYNSKTNVQLGSLGTKTTNLPLTKDMIEQNNRILSGTHLSDGDIFYPAIRSIVNLKQEKHNERTRNQEFPFIQLAALLELRSINTKVFSENFKDSSTENPLLILLNNTKDEVQKEMLLQMIEENNLNEEINRKTFSEEVETYFSKDFDFNSVINDRLLHEFVFSWYENEGKSLEDYIHESQNTNDHIQETTLIDAKKEIANLGFDTAKLLEKFPVVTMGIGYTRKTYERKKAVLNPFNKIINNKKMTVIPILKNENEAIIFKLNPLRVFAWLQYNNLIDKNIIPSGKEEAHAFLYEHLKLGERDVDELAQIDIEKINDETDFASILIFQLIHTQMHMLLNAGKSILGLDVDSISEYLFPSALAGAIYVSKLQGGGMGTLIAAFENDLARWLRNTYEKSQTCIYDPVCKGQQGACHACSYLKFSCQCFNRGVSRNLLIGGNIGNKPLVGFLTKEIDDHLKLLLTTTVVL